MISGQEAGFGPHVPLVACSSHPDVVTTSAQPDASDGNVF